MMKAAEIQGLCQLWKREQQQLKQQLITHDDVDWVLPAAAAAAAAEAGSRGARRNGQSPHGSSTATSSLSGRTGGAEGRAPTHAELQAQQPAEPASAAASEPAALAAPVEAVAAASASPSAAPAPEAPAASASAAAAAPRPLRYIGGVDISFIPRPGPSRSSAVRASVPDIITDQREPHVDAPHDGDPAALQGRREPDEAQGELQGEPEQAVAALVVMAFPELKVVYEDFEPVTLTLPYMPGFLAFREVPVLCRLLRRAAPTPYAPQVVLVDGCGLLHPEGFGAACHLGVVSGLPCIGVAKNLLAVDGLDRDAVRQSLQALNAEKARPPPPQTPPTPTQQQQQQHGLCPSAADAHVPPGPSSDAEAASAPAAQAASCVASATTANRGPPGNACSLAGSNASSSGGTSSAGLSGLSGTSGTCLPLLGASSGQVLGAALTCGSSAKPIFVSVGHRLSLTTAVELVRRCCIHRIPEPVRQADLRSREYIRLGRHLLLQPVAPTAPAAAPAMPPAAVL